MVLSDSPISTPSTLPTETPPSSLLLSPPLHHPPSTHYPNHPPWPPRSSDGHGDASSSASPPLPRSHWRRQAPLLLPTALEPFPAPDPPRSRLLCASLKRRRALHGRGQAPLARAARVQAQAQALVVVVVRLSSSAGPLWRAFSSATSLGWCPCRRRSCHGLRMAAERNHRF